MKAFSTIASLSLLSLAATALPHYGTIEEPLVETTVKTNDDISPNNPDSNNSGQAKATIQFIKNNTPQEIEVVIGATSDRSSNPIPVDKAVIVSISSGQDAQGNAVKSNKVVCSVKKGGSSKVIAALELEKKVEFEGENVKISAIECNLMG